MSLVLLNAAEPGAVLNRDTKTDSLSRSRIDHESPLICEFYARAHGIGVNISIMTEPSRGPLLNLLIPCGWYPDRGEGYITPTPLSEATRLPPKRAMLESTPSYTSKTTPSQAELAQTVLYPG